MGQGAPGSRARRIAAVLQIGELWSAVELSLIGNKACSNDSANTCTVG